MCITSQIGAKSRHCIALLSALIRTFSAFLVMFPQIKCPVHIITHMTHLLPMHLL